MVDRDSTACVADPLILSHAERSSGSSDGDRARVRGWRLAQSPFLAFRAAQAHRSAAAINHGRTCGRAAAKAYPFTTARGALNMNSLAGFDWIGYFRSLSDDEMSALAAWLVAERLAVGEFMEVVDRVYARMLADPIASEWRGQPSLFVGWYGRPGAEEYARRKRQFADLMATFDAACMMGALPGDVAPEELEATQADWTKAPSLVSVLGALEYARHDSE